MSKGSDPTPGASSAAHPPGVGFAPAQLADAVEGLLRHTGSEQVVGAGVDSRRLARGEAFFALPGEQTDGHRFLEAAAAAGAAALVVSEELPADRLEALVDGSPQTSVIEVPDTAVALRRAAARYRDRFDPLVVGITGSVAKTSTKELTAEVLAGRFEVLRSRGNENNEIGLPLTLLRLRPEHEIAVLEMGFYTIGEIALLARLARPSIGVVTAVRGVHLSRAGSIEAIETGKGELVEALPGDGWAILNADDPRVMRMTSRTRARVLTYGFAPGADVRAESVSSLGAEGMRFRLHLPAGSADVSSPVLGRHGVHNALAAAAVATCAGLTLDEIVAGLGREVLLPHRSRILHAGPWTILDDSYNASPDAVLAALDLLAGLPGRRIAVLGEMLELGETADSEHRRVGAGAAAIVDELVVVGPGAKGLADGALAAGMDPARIHAVADREEALAVSLRELRAGDTILVKASRGAALDLLVERLLQAAEAGVERA